MKEKEQKKNAAAAGIKTAAREVCIKRGENLLKKKTKSSEEVLNPFIIRVGFIKRLTMSKKRKKKKNEK